LKSGIVVWILGLRSSGRTLHPEAKQVKEDWEAFLLPGERKRQVFLEPHRNRHRIWKTEARFPKTGGAGSKDYNTDIKKAGHKETGLSSTTLGQRSL
jgi:hypothetical protein